MKTKGEENISTSSTDLELPVWKIDEPSGKLRDEMCKKS